MMIIMFFCNRNDNSFWFRKLTTSYINRKCYMRSMQQLIAYIGTIMSHIINKRKVLHKMLLSIDNVTIFCLLKVQES